MELAEPVRQHLAKQWRGMSRVLVLGIDPERVRSRPGGPEIHGTALRDEAAAELDRAAVGSYDAVLIAGLLYQLPSPDAVRKVLDGARAALKPGGKLHILEPNARYLGRRFWDSARAVTPITHRSLAAIAAETGFELRDMMPKFLPMTWDGWLARCCVRSDWMRMLFGRHVWLEAQRSSTTAPVDPAAFLRRSEEPQRHFLWLCVILLLGLLGRLYQINEPPNDAYHWRETQTLMIAKGFYEHEMNIFHPRVLWRTITEVHPQGYVGGTELMVTPFLTALLYFIFGAAYWVNRVVPIFFSLLGVAFFHRVAARFCGWRAATLAAALLCFSPIYFYVGRVQMPESFAFCMSFMTVYYFDRWLEEERYAGFWPAALSCTFMLLAKPQMVWMAVPLLYLVLTRHGMRAVSQPRLYVFLAPVAVPCALYVWWSFIVLTHETRIVFQAPGIGAMGFRYLKDPYLYTHIATVAWNKAVGPMVCVGAMIGLLYPARVSRGWFPHVYAVASVLSILVAPGLHWANDYYQAFFAPPAALLMGRLLAAGFRKWYLGAGAAAISVAAIVASLHIAATYYARDQIAIWHCGEWIRANTPATARVLVSYNDPTVLYDADRIGWICRDQADGQPMKLNQALIAKAQALGATVLAAPIGAHLDNYPANRRVPLDLRDYLYDTFPCYRAEDFAVFFLNQSANVTLPHDGRIEFGDPQSFKYLRGDWNCIYKAAPTGAFVHKGPAPGSIVFKSPAWLKRIVMKVSSEKPDRHVRISFDGQLVGEGILDKAWNIYEMPIDFTEPVAAEGKHTITIEPLNEGGEAGKLLFWSLQAEFRSPS